MQKLYQVFLSCWDLGEKNRHRIERITQANSRREAEEQILRNHLDWVTEYQCYATWAGEIINGKFPIKIW